MFCRNCGQELPEGTIFCTKCGANQGTEQKKEKSRTTELVLGLLGGIFGFFGALFAIGVGGLGAAFGGLICISFAFLLPFILLLIGGIMARRE